MQLKLSPFWHRCLTRLKPYLSLFIFLLLLELFVEVRYFVSVGQIYIGEIFYSTISLLLWASLPTLIVALMPTRWLRISVETIIVIVAIFLFLFENFLIYSYGVFYTDSIALNILATNPSEASLFLENIRLGSFILPIIFLILVSLIAVATRRYLRHRAKTLRLPLVYGLFSLALLPLAMVTTIPAQNKVWSYNYMAPVERLVRGTYRCLEDGKSLAKYIQGVKNIDLGNVERTKDLGEANIILILGESMSRNYMHCYGYPLPNTPHLDSLVSTGDLVLFHDVIASAAYTASSISESNSLYHREATGKNWFDFPTLDILLSRAGYYTYWVSNQEAQGAGVQPVATIAATADSTRYAKKRAYGDWNSAQDEALLPLLADRSLALQHGKQALFETIHIMGSHTPYAFRFTDSFARFKGSDLPAKSPYGTPTPTEEKKRENLSNYVNSIYYNDWVIAQILKKYEDTPTLVIYLSDHAQSLYENPERPDYYEHEASLPGLSIPLMVYFTPKMRSAFPELYQQVVDAKDRRIMSDLLANSVCGLLGVKSKFYQPNLDFFSPEYNNDRPRTISVYGGKTISL